MSSFFRSNVVVVYRPSQHEDLTCRRWSSSLQFRYSHIKHSVLEQHCWWWLWCWAFAHFSIISSYDFFVIFSFLSLKRKPNLTQWRPFLIKIRSFSVKLHIHINKSEKQIDIIFFPKASFDGTIWFAFQHAYISNSFNPKFKTQSTICIK